MPATPLTAEIRAALFALLDDQSLPVRRALLGYLHEQGEHGRDFLQEVLRSPNRVAAFHARWFASQLKLPDPVGEFREFIRSLGYELEVGAILLSRTVHPQLDISGLCRELDRIAGRCRELMTDEQPTREKCLALNRVLFRELGFHGNTDHYTDPKNSFLDRVVERRTGLPVTLSILYILVAERCGLRLEPVALPGHFVVGSYETGAVFFVDPFDQGRFLSPDDIFTYLEKRKIEPNVTYLAPTTVRETLCRCCRNLVRHYEAEGDDEHARLFSDFVEEFETAFEHNAQP